MKGRTALQVVWLTLAAAVLLAAALSPASLTGHEYSGSFFMRCLAVGASWSILTFYVSTEGNDHGPFGRYDHGGSQPKTIDTPAAMDLQLSMQWGEATAANEIELHLFTVEEIR